jgi:septal ring factor EnvC (AmiA/AmiB activator)
MASRFTDLALACGLALAIGTAAPGAAQAPAQNDRTRASQRAGERIKALQRESEALAAQESKLLAELKGLETERQARVRELAEAEGQLAETQKALADAGARAKALEQTAEAQRPEAEARMVKIYKLGSAGYWRLLLDVDDLRSLGRAYRTAAALHRIDRDRVIEHQRTLEALAREQKELAARAAELDALRQKAARARTAAERAVAARTALVASIDARRDLNAQLISELQAAQQRLQSGLAELDAAGGAAHLPLRPFRGALPWPVSGRVVVRFGRQPDNRFGTAIVRNGIEIAAPEGQPVRVVHEGTVAFAGQFTGYGNLVIVEHGDRTFSLYGHLGALQVARGDQVAARRQVGTSGLNPSGNPVLYFELRVDGKPVDPVQWLQKGTP